MQTKILGVRTKDFLALKVSYSMLDAVYLLDLCDGPGSGQVVKMGRAGLIRVVLMAQGTISMVLRKCI